MTKEEWVERATEFFMGMCAFQNRRLYISSRPQLTGPTKWVVQLEHSMCWVLGKDKKWHWEPQPSSRTEAFIENTRFNSPDEAWDFYSDNVKEQQDLYID